MRQYELMVILDPDLEERTVSPSLDQYLSVVRNGGGSVEKIDVWGRRRLAYEITKKPEGIYAVVNLTAEPAVVQELDRQLNLNEAVLRTKVLRPSARPAKQRRAVAHALAKATDAANARAAAPAAAPAPAAPAPPAAAPAPAATAPAPAATAPAPVAPTPTPAPVAPSPEA